MMKTITDFLKGPQTTAAAAQLAQAVRMAEAERATAQSTVDELLAKRHDLLMTDDDKALDDVEVRLTAAQRALDRLDVRIPELARRHAEREAAERVAANREAFEKAVAARTAAAAKIDGALTTLGGALLAFETAGADVAALEDYHGALTRGVTGAGKVDYSAFKRAFSHHAPSALRYLNVQSDPFLPPAPFEPGERQF